ncbi:unnamed protein product, partial [Phaeothamnion confervicola]
SVQTKTRGQWGRQAAAFLTGVADVVPRRLLALFGEHELALLVSGSPTLDVGDWRRHARWQGPTRAQEWFWRLVGALSQEERALLLKFTTGCSQLPAGGFTDRPFVVVVVPFDPRYPLPRAATCFGQLKMPDYPDEGTLEQSLLVAIRYGCEGFTFV